MSKIQKKLVIELTMQEKKFLDDLLSSLYDFEDDSEMIGKIFCDIYNSYKPDKDEKSSKWIGSQADIIIMK